MIKIENVTKTFKENTVLNNVSINFEKGKIHGLWNREIVSRFAAETAAEKQCL